MKKVLLAANISESFKKLLDDKGYESIVYSGGEVPSGIQGIVTTTKLMLDSKLLSALPDLKWIARLGSGIEIIDTEYCKQNNIAFASSPAGIANAVGEHCVASLISLQKNISKGFNEINNNIWSREPNRGWEIEGSTIGLIGYGHTGQAFAKKLKGFGCNILAYDKYKTGFGSADIGEVTLEELQQKSNVISFHVPANEETYHYYNAQFISNCKKHILVNTSRGDIVNTKDLLEALESNKVIGAALDVLENEQFLHDKTTNHWNIVKQLLQYNVIITPHIAGYTFNAIEKMSTELIDKLREVF